MSVSLQCPRPRLAHVLSCFAARALIERPITLVTLTHAAAFVAEISLAKLAVDHLAAFRTERQNAGITEVHVAAFSAEGVPAIIAEEGLAAVLAERLPASVTEGCPLARLAKYLLADVTRSRHAASMAELVQTDSTVATKVAIAAVGLAALCAIDDYWTASLGRAAKLAALDASGLLEKVTVTTRTRHERVAVIARHLVAPLALLQCMSKVLDDKTPRRVPRADVHTRLTRVLPSQMDHFKLASRLEHRADHRPDQRWLKTGDGPRHGTVVASEAQVNFFKAC